MANEDVRKKAKENKVYQWQIADVLGIDEWAYGRKLRHELSVQEKQEILKIIDKLSKKTE